MIQSGRRAVCVAGWHLDAATYVRVADWAQADVYVVSHRREGEVSEAIRNAVPSERWLARPNYGYDWGCYQQFLETGLWRAYDRVMFMHDDVELRSPGVFDRCETLFGEGCSVVANGRLFPKRNWPGSHPEAYLHSSWQPLPGFEHDTVRGSFFAVTREALGALGCFEVFWDRFHLTSYFGNWSTWASCGKLQALRGETCFGFLSDTWCESEYLSELTRGGQEGDPRAGESPRQRVGAALVYHVARTVMRRRMDRVGLKPGLFMRAMEQFARLAAGRPAIRQQEGE